MLRLVWSRLALLDAEAIFAYIARDNVRAAVATEQSMLNQVETLRSFPASGRPGRTFNTRELVLRPSPYIAYYQVNSDSGRLLRIVHGAGSSHR